MDFLKGREVWSRSEGIVDFPKIFLFFHFIKPFSFHVRFQKKNIFNSNVGLKVKFLTFSILFI